MYLEGTSKRTSTSVFLSGCDITVSHSGFFLYGNGIASTSQPIYSSGKSTIIESNKAYLYGYFGDKAFDYVKAYINGYRYDYQLQGNFLKEIDVESQVRVPISLHGSHIVAYNINSEFSKQEEIPGEFNDGYDLSGSLK